MAQKRQTKTEERIRAALVELLPTRGIDGISVSDIARTAGINRGTFYAHYADKYDAVESQASAVSDTLMRIVLDRSEEDAAGVEISFERVREAMRYVRDNYRFIAALSQNGTNMKLYEVIKETLGTVLDRTCARAGAAPSYLGAPEDYGREMLLAGITAVIWLWIRKGCPESPEEIARIIWTTKTYSPADLLKNPM